MTIHDHKVLSKCHNLDNFRRYATVTGCVPNTQIKVFQRCAPYVAFTVQALWTQLIQSDFRVKSNCLFQSSIEQPGSSSAFTSHCYTSSRKTMSLFILEKLWDFLLPLSQSASESLLTCYSLSAPRVKQALVCQYQTGQAKVIRNTGIPRML